MPWSGILVKDQHHLVVGLEFCYGDCYCKLCVQIYFNIKAGISISNILLEKLDMDMYKYLMSIIYSV